MIWACLSASRRQALGLINVIKIIMTTVDYRMRVRQRVKYLHKPMLQTFNNALNCNIQKCRLFRYLYVTHYNMYLGNCPVAKSVGHIELQHTKMSHIPLSIFHTLQYVYRELPRRLECWAYRYSPGVRSRHAIQPWRELKHTMSLRPMRYRLLYI